ncbi:unnamed protein product, partial [Darwinula stevensoni]
RLQLVTRRRATKKRKHVPLTEEMLNELNKDHMGGVESLQSHSDFNTNLNMGMSYKYHDPTLDLWNNDSLFYDPRKAVRDRKTPVSRSHSPAGYPGTGNGNIYDSWRTDWSGYNTVVQPGFSLYNPRATRDYDTEF